MLDEIEHPAQRANATTGIATIASVLAAIGAIVGILKPLMVSGAPSISVIDVLIILSAGGGALVQIALFLQSIPETPQHRRAVGYAQAMIADCRAQEEEEYLGARGRIGDETDPGEEAAEAEATSMRSKAT